MSSRTTLIVLFASLCTLILLSFALWGDHFEALFSFEASIDVFESRARLAGPLAVLLLCIDLLLPIPSTGVLGALGAVLAPLPAFLWGWSGLVLSGLLGYGAARLGGTRWANRLASPAEQFRYRALFDTWGGLAIVITRLLPVLPEALAVLAGLYRMTFPRFLLATLIGSIPPALVFTWLGARARQSPGPALWTLVALTALAWLAFLHLRKSAGITPPAEKSA